MILLLGAAGYVGRAFANALRRRKGSFIPLSRSTLDYTRFEVLFDYVRKVRPELVINAEENPPWPREAPGRMEMNSLGPAAVKEPIDLTPGNGDGSEEGRMQMLETNALFPQTVARVCSMTNTPWGHVSSGSIYRGAKVLEEHGLRLEMDLASPAARGLYSLHPDRFRGFSEADEPNFSFRRSPCTFYSGTKALAEEAILDHGQGYIWRLRLPFNKEDEPRNFLSQLTHANQVSGGINSLSHLDDCVNACWDIWERRAPFGIYNVVNPGAVTTNELIQMVQRILRPSRQFLPLVCENEPISPECRVPHADCILDGSKLVSLGVRLRGVREAVEKTLESWEPQRVPSLWTFA